ncbi:serine peptidase [Streptomyces sp. NPDC012888]|uniref:serine peptidase n=1 Tax=Streptomyces sp. NPDC012888 TaxID=3364855 RepID=UPI003677C578
MRILGVHGVGNFRPAQSPDQAAAELAGIWTKALSRGSRGELREHGRAQGHRTVTIAYYADLIQRQGSQGANDLDSLDDYEQALVAQWLDACGLPQATAAGRLTAPLRQGLAWLAKSRGLGQAATEWFVALCFREVAAYLRGPARPQARSRVADALTTHRPDVVIAHSLGSVVAYETMWEHPELEVELLITLGSPLALPHAVFPRLEPAPIAELGRRPPNVARWINLADPGDLVAIPPGGVKRCFEGVQEPKNEPIHAFDFHKATNYLATPQLRTLLDTLA